MEHLPVFINLRQKPCLVVGGGDIALRKVNLLLKAQAKIKCISPEFCSGLIELSRENSLDLIERRFESTDIDKQSVIIAATNDDKTNAMVSNLAHESGIPINVVDSPDLSSFIMPSIVDRSPIVIAISSAGKAPVLARIIREYQNITEWPVHRDVDATAERVISGRPDSALVVGASRFRLATGDRQGDPHRWGRAHCQDRQRHRHEAGSTQKVAVFVSRRIHRVFSGQMLRAGLWCHPR